MLQDGKPQPRDPSLRNKMRATTQCAQQPLNAHPRSGCATAHLFDAAHDPLDVHSAHPGGVMARLSRPSPLDPEGPLGHAEQGKDLLLQFGELGVEELHRLAVA